MGIIILPISWSLLFLWFHKRQLNFAGEKSADGRSSFLLTSVCWGAVLTGITEGLSLLKLLTCDWVLAVWGMVCLIVLTLLLSHPGPHARLISLRSFLELPLFQKVLLSGVAFITAITLFIALKAAPNNWDSMVYHMSRVNHWIQNRSVGHYPTSSIRQLCLNPWAEFAILHAQLLGDGDRYANMVQWFSMFGCLIGVSLVAGQLGAGRLGQILAVVICATIPMGILQSTSTQNDYVEAFWLVCLVHFVLLLRPEFRWRNLIPAGVALSLAILTKGTGYIYALPVCIWLVGSLLSNLGYKVWRPVLFLLAAVIIMNSGHYIRNYNLFASPMGPASHTKLYSNQPFGPGQFISNVIRNISVHLATGNKRYNKAMENAVKSIHEILGQDVNDSRTSWQSWKYGIPVLSRQEDKAGNLVHLILIMAAFPLGLFHPLIRENRDLLRYMTAVAAGFLIFCFYLKWQPWHSRLHLPLFVMWSPVLALILEEVQGLVPAFGLGGVYTIAVVLLLYSFPFALKNKSRNLFGDNSILRRSRTEQYFYNRKDLAVPYIKTAEFIAKKGCKNIGISMYEDSWEYPLWELLKKDNKYVRVEQIDVRNESAVIKTDFKPCVIVHFKSDGSGMDVHVTN